MFGDILEGAARFGMSYVGGKKRLERREAAQTAYDQSMANYFNQDTSNLYANMENTAEDLTVNTQAADFAAQQQAQGQANIMNQMRSSAGGSGIAALAQSLAANQQARVRQAASNQRMELMGADQSRAMKASLLGERLAIDTNELASAEQAIQAAQQARTEAVGQAAGGVGDAAGLALAGYTGDNPALKAMQKAQLAQQKQGG